jgi:thiamine kinase-like enzyme
MTLESVYRNILSKLVGLGAISEECLVNGSIVVGTGRQRNRFFYVKHPKGRSFFLKQPAGEFGAAESLRREASVYKLIANNDYFRAVTCLMPSFVNFEEDPLTLVLEMFLDSQDLGTKMLQRGEFDLSLIRAFGLAASRIHAVPVSQFYREESLFDQKIHWIFRLDEEPSPLPSLRSRSIASESLIEKILTDARLTRSLQRRRGSWRATHFIHGDYKWENALSLSDKESSLRIIDWEWANLGEPAWDVCYGFVAIMVFWLNVRRNSPLLPVCAEVVMAMRCFWDGYMAGCRGSIHDETNFLRKVIEMMGARMLVVAFELCYEQNSIPPSSLSLLNGAKSLLEGEGDRLLLALEAE